MIYFSRLSIPIFGPNRTLTLSSLFALPIMLILIFIQPLKIISVEDLIYIIVVGITIIAARLSLYRGMRTIPMTILMPLVSLFPIIPMAFGIFVLGESLTLLQGIGAGIAVIGIMMLSR